jgi:hypothetical protein
MADKILSAPRLNEVVSYDAATGGMTWAESIGSKVAGTPVGRLLKAGYLRARIDGQAHYVHRLAWLYFYGKWPQNLIDHIDGDKTNNRIANLRDVTSSVNQQNRSKPRRDSVSGLMGVRASQGKWCATIRVDGKDCFLGYHSTPEAASAAYQSAKSRSHAGNDARPIRVARVLKTG